MIEIQHQDTGFVLLRGDEQLGELRTRRGADGSVTLVHTHVSDTLRGQGWARKLVGAAVDWARETGTKLSVTCPYAKSVFEKEPELRDVLAG